MSEELKYNQLPSILAVLIAEGGNYSYVDKLANAPSKDLALMYLREALRDINSLLASGKFENEEAKKELERVDFRGADYEIKYFSESVRSRTDLREHTSYIAARALAKAAKLRGEEPTKKRKTEEVS